MPIVGCRTLIVTGPVFGEQVTPDGQLGLHLVSASFHQSAHEEWTLPYPVEELLSWAWQRAEVEVCHREMKSGFGLRETQCWGLTQRSSL